MAFAFTVAVLHAVTVVLLLTGALLALRYRRVVLVHAPVTAAVAAVHVAGADCPLTIWERTLRVRSGQPYDGGFLDHYLFEPLRLDAADPAVQAGIYIVVVVPNVIGYAVLAVRARRRALVSPCADSHLLDTGRPPAEREPQLSPTGHR